MSSVNHVGVHSAVSLCWLLLACCSLCAAGQVVSEFPACNATYFRCATAGCLNTSFVCDGQDNCGDNSDEDVRYAGCPESHRLSGGLIAAIAIGSLVGAVLLCCWISSVIECIQHMYKYWCSCCHETDINDITFTTTVLPNPGADPTTIVVAGTLPPSYSSIFRNDAAFLAEASSTSLPNYQTGSFYGVPPIRSLAGPPSDPPTPPSGPRSLPQMTGPGGTGSPVGVGGVGGVGGVMGGFGGTGGMGTGVRGSGSLVGMSAGSGGMVGVGGGSGGMMGVGGVPASGSGGNLVISQQCHRCQCQCQRQQQVQQQQQQQQQGLLLQHHQPRSQLQQMQEQQLHSLPQSASLPLPDYPPPRYDPAKDIRWC